MNAKSLLPFLLFCTGVFSQGAIHNFGNLQLHSKGSVGFHTDFINDSGFNENLGLVGFYHDESNLLISGTSSPVFFDFEIAVENDLYIDEPITIGNSLNFIYGNITSFRNNKNIYTKISENAFYEGAVDMAKINGHAAVEGQKIFSFPVGDENLIRPLSLEFIDGPFLAKCAYFRENPNFPEGFPSGFDINRKDADLSTIHTQEFWNVTTSGMIQITLNWNSDGNLKSIVEEIEHITVAGWNKKNEQWTNLGNFKHEGEIDQGWVTSNTFNANDYEIFTLGFLFNLNNIDSGNYALTPNGDGANDFFILKIVEEYPSNKLLIFNREGQLVYEKTDYQNEFNGIGNKKIIQKGQHLEEGVYFYILEIKAHNLKYQGYIYLAK
jgi:gliding motility-associated-like protein